MRNEHGRKTLSPSAWLFCSRGCCSDLGFAPTDSVIAVDRVSQVLTFAFFSALAVVGHRIVYVAVGKVALVPAFSYFLFLFLLIFRERVHHMLVVVIWASVGLARVHTKMRQSDRHTHTHTFIHSQTQV